jgi:hypothetical protein
MWLPKYKSTLKDIYEDVLNEVQFESFLKR